MRQQQLGQGRVFGRALVAGAGEDLGRDGTPEVGQLLGPLVDQQHHDTCRRLLGADGTGDLLQHRGLAGFGRRDDQAARALADGRQQIHSAHGDVTARAEVEALGRVHRDELGERGAGAVSRGRQAADRGHRGQLAARPALHHRPGHRGPLDQGVFPQEAGWYADLARGRLHRVDQHRAAAAAFQDTVGNVRHWWCQWSRAPPYSVCRKLCRKDVVNRVAKMSQT